MLDVGGSAPVRLGQGEYAKRADTLEEFVLESEENEEEASAGIRVQATGTEAGGQVPKRKAAVLEMEEENARKQEVLMEIECYQHDKRGAEKKIKLAYWRLQREELEEEKKKREAETGVEEGTAVGEEMLAEMRAAMKAEGAKVGRLVAAAESAIATLDKLHREWEQQVADQSANDVDKKLKEMSEGIKKLLGEMVDQWGASLEEERGCSDEKFAAAQAAFEPRLAEAEERHQVKVAEMEKEMAEIDKNVQSKVAKVLTAHLHSVGAQLKDASYIN